jgi:hypothetical protein
MGEPKSKKPTLEDIRKKNEEKYKGLDLKSMTGDEIRRFGEKPPEAQTYDRITSGSPPLGPAGTFMGRLAEDSLMGLPSEVYSAYKGVTDPVPGQSRWDSIDAYDLQYEGELERGGKRNPQAEDWGELLSWFSPGGLAAKGTKKIVGKAMQKAAKPARNYRTAKDAVESLRAQRAALESGEAARKSVKAPKTGVRRQLNPIAKKKQANKSALTEAEAALNAATPKPSMAGRAVNMARLLGGKMPVAPKAGAMSRVADRLEPGVSKALSAYSATPDTLRGAAASAALDAARLGQSEASQALLSEDMTDAEKLAALQALIEKQKAEQ